MLHTYTEAVKKPIEISASEFKAKCLQILDQVAESGCVFTVTKHGKPVARLSPIPEEAPLGGSWEGKVKILGDIVHFNSSEDWEANR